MPLGRGGRHFLVRARPYVVKIAADPHASCTREVFGLRALPRGLGPKLVAHASAAELLERAPLDVITRLDAPVGPTIVMEEVRGAHAAAAHIGETARALRLLHGRRTARGPSLMVPADPARVLAMARERAHALDVDASRAFARAEKHVDLWWRRGLQAGARVLCHGDLRWHNLVWEGRRVRLLDLEHAGIGDAATDLAMFGTTLSLHDELLLLDAYQPSRTFLDRYFAQKPMLSLLLALDGALELSAYARGDRFGARPAKEQWALRRDEVRDALARHDVRLTTHRRLWVGGLPPVLDVQRRSRRTPRATVAIDGHAAAGKSEIARALATHWGVAWINTGAAYRYAALVALRRRLDPRNARDIATLARTLRNDVRAKRVRLDDDGGIVVVERNRERALRAALGVASIDGVVSRWAALPAVREALAPLIARALARVTRVGGVVEGRDVATVLLPRAQHKLFVTASLAQRAAFVARKPGRDVIGTDARALIASRDRMDESRVIAPLVRARDARLLDTTGMTREQAIAQALALLRRGSSRKRGRT
jgi:CMP/dCMP kinase